MKISNMLKIADFEVDQLDSDFVAWLDHQMPTYKDTLVNLNEHIYNVEDLQAVLDEWPSNKYINNQLDMIKRELQENDCSFFRIIKN